jgi:hypothetical protein
MPGFRIPGNILPHFHTPSWLGALLSIWTILSLLEALLNKLRSETPPLPFPCKITILFTVQRRDKYFCLLEAFVVNSNYIWAFNMFRKPAVYEKTLSLHHGSFRSHRKSAGFQFPRISCTRRHTLRAGTDIQSASRYRNTASSWLSGSSGLTNVSSSTTLEVSVTHILPGQACRIIRAQQQGRIG